jgi:hypothetical protein
MSGATRYTTSHKRGLEDMLADALFSILLKPPVFAGGLASLAASYAHLPPRAVAGIGMTVFVLVLMIWLWRTQFGFSARLARVMVELGLVYRDDEGVLHGPQRLGRARSNGRNRRLRWRLPPGVTLRDVLDRQEAIEHRCVCELRCSMENGHLHMEVLRHQIPRLVKFDEFYRGPRPGGRLLIGLGLGRRGAMWVDLATLPHLLVGGMTGGGKSIFLSQALTFLATEYSPQRVQFVCVDLKGGLELAPFAELPHSRQPVADTIESAAGSLGAIRDELDRRLEALRRAGYRDIDEWSDAEMPDWPRVVVVVDEVAELTVRDLGGDKVGRAAQQAAVGRLCEIARLGRAAGIHLIVCTQRPDAEAVPGQLKANLAGTVAFRVRSGVNSLILLDSDRASMLPPHPGRAVWAHDREEEFQGVYLSGEDSLRRLEQRWGAKLIHSTTGSVTPWCQTPQTAPVEQVADDEDVAR